MFSVSRPSPRGQEPRGEQTEDTAPPLEVLVASRQPSHRLNYVDQLIGDDSAGEAPDGIAYVFRDRPMGAEITARAVHLTNISAVVGDRRTSDRERLRRAKRFRKVLKRRRIALVRTLLGSELGAHRQISHAESVLNDATTSFVVVDPAVAAPPGRSAVVIPHSHMRGRFLGYPREESISGRLLIVSSGILPAAYEATLKVFAAADLPRHTLHVVGGVPAALADSYSRTLSRSGGRISLRAEALSDAARVTEITGAEIVVVAAPDSHEALTTIMLALSLDRPVLVEATPSTRVLADEVGDAWVRLHDGRLTVASLESALTDLSRNPATGHPNLDARDPNGVAAQYATAYRAAVAVVSN